MRRLTDIIIEQRPLTLAGQVSVRDACRCMAERAAGSVLVLDQGGKLAGIFTGRDAVSRVLAVCRDPATTALQDVMTRNPTTLSPANSAADALRAMWDGGFRHVPVVEEGRVLGVVSRGDMKGEEIDRLDGERSLWEHMR